MSDLRARLLALQDAVGELLSSAGAPERARRVDDAPYSVTVAVAAGELSAVRVPIVRGPAPAAGLRLRVAAGGEQRVAALAPAALADRDEATFTFEPLAAAVAAPLVELHFESCGGQGQPTAALRLTAAGRPALLFGHGGAGAVARPKRPPLLSRDNWIEAARLLRREGPVALAARVLRRLTKPPPAPPRPWRDRYPEWLAARAHPSDTSITTWREEARSAGSPSFAVVLLPGPGDAERSRASIAAQLWPAWGVVDLREAAPGWPAIESDYVVPLRAGDLLAPHALLRLAAAAKERPALVTADEDRVDAEGTRSDPFFKPSLTASRLRCEDYVAGVAAFRSDARFGSTAMRTWEGVIWDAAVRRAAPGAAARVQDVLVSRGAPRGRAPDDDARALLAEEARRLGWEGAQVRPGRVAGTHRLAPPIAGEPLVSIVIPFRDKADVLERAVASIDAKSTYRRRELLLVDNGSREPDTKRLLERLAGAGGAAAGGGNDAAASGRAGSAAGGVRVIPQPGPFNFARINNAAAREARGELLLFLNNDVEVLEPSWLEALVEQVQRTDVGAAGARLLFPEGFVQHAGVILGMGGIAGHPGRLMPPASGGYHGSFDVLHDYSAVTAACMMIRREVFHAVGGFDEQTLPIGFNDVDLCLKLRARGLLVVYTPFAELLHHESLSRGPRVDDAEVATMRQRWGPQLAADPYYNANLSLERDDFEVRP